MPDRRVLCPRSDGIRPRADGDNLLPRHRKSLKRKLQQHHVENWAGTRLVAFAKSFLWRKNGNWLWRAVSACALVIVLFFFVVSSRRWSAGWLFDRLHVVKKRGAQARARGVMIVPLGVSSICIFLNGRSGDAVTSAPAS